MWPVTIVVVAVIAGVVGLSIMDKDVSALVAFAITALGGLIYGKLEHVKELANGNMSRLMDQVERMSNKLAEMQPPVNGDSNTTQVTVVTPGEVDTTTATF